MLIDMLVFAADREATLQHCTSLHMSLLELANKASLPCLFALYSVPVDWPCLPDCLMLPSLSAGCDVNQRSNDDSSSVQSHPQPRPGWQGSANEYAHKCNISK